MDVILLAGGKGSRLWPMSRKGLPKHLLSVFGEQSLFQDTILRALPLLSGEDRIVVVTNEEQRRLLSQQLTNIGVGEERVLFLIEPLGRNTAPALLWAVCSLHSMGCLGAALMLPCDHLIPDTEAFVSSMRKAEEFVLKNEAILVFGIRPSYPSTGYGYIEIDNLQEGGFASVKGFKEKPNLENAISYLESGRYLWNSGILAFSIERMIQDARRFMPEMLEKIEEMLDSGDMSGYGMLESISIDYALLEKVDELWCMPANFRWSDMGSWKSVYDMSQKDGDGNAVISTSLISLDSGSNLVLSNKNKIIALVEQQGLVVVDTLDSLLICPMDKVERVKEIANTLEESNDSSWADPAKVERGWGYYIVLDKGPRYKTKRIVVYPGRSLSMQRHNHRSEHWVVLQGVARVYRDGEVFEVHPNESTYIPVGIKHKLENPGKIALEIIEVQNGDYLEEDDIERFDE